MPLETWNQLEQWVFEKYEILSGIESSKLSIVNK
jgi:hypothetical protein